MGVNGVLLITVFLLKTKILINFFFDFFKSNILLPKATDIFKIFVYKTNLIRAMNDAMSQQKRGEGNNFWFDRKKKKNFCVFWVLSFT